MADLRDDPVPPNTSLRTVTLVAYALFGLGFITSGLFAFAPIAAVMMIYIKRPDAAGTYYAAHFDWLIATFLWGLLWMAVSYLLVFILIGWVGIVATVLWVLYRLIKGVLALLEFKAPQAF